MCIPSKDICDYDHPEEEKRNGEFENRELLVLIMIGLSLSLVTVFTLLPR